MVVEIHQEENGPWNVNERIDSIDPDHGQGVFEEEVLNWQLPKYVELLLEVNHLKCMLASYVHSRVHECKSSKSATKLINLQEFKLVTID